jgi:hypothetical protein
MAKKSGYKRIIEDIFLQHHQKGLRSFVFDRSEIVETAERLGLDVPKNLGDVIYSFRYRSELPVAILEVTPVDQEWIILPAGSARYRFSLSRLANIQPTAELAKTKIPDAIPGVVTKYKLSDEQALLARLRYNRLIDVFLRMACYSLQNHLRTFVRDLGQIETDEIYIGIERRGAHCVIPIQAKGGKDKISIVQIVQDFALCRHHPRFSSLICIPVAAQFIDEDEIALFAFEESEDGPKITSEKHYVLVPPEKLTKADLELYRSRAADEAV